MVIWIIGLSGAGKTTIGREIHDRLRARRPNVVFLDGGAIRSVMNDDLAHTLEDRRANAWRLTRLSALLDSQGIDVICATISIFPETREWIRRNGTRCFEVFLDVPFEVLVARDDKGLYGDALAGRRANVVGVDLPFEAPKKPDLRIPNTFEPGSSGAMADRIVAAVGEVFGP